MLVLRLGLGIVCWDDYKVVRVSVRVSVTVRVRDSLLG